MRKLLIKFFLPVIILLLSGYNQAYAKAYEDCICLNQTKTFFTPDQLDECTVKDTPAMHVKFTQSDVEELNDGIDTTDSENEDDNLASKKLVPAHKYSAAVFNIQTPEYTDLQSKKGFNNFKHFFHFTSYRRYIIFRVIRI